METTLRRCAVSVVFYYTDCLYKVLKVRFKQRMYGGIMFI